MAKLILLTTEPENWAPKELIKKAKEKGFDTEVINPDECYINLSEDPYISYKGTKFLSADICIPRLSEDQMDYKISIIDHIEKMGVKVINKGVALKTASNKIETQIKLNAADLKTPKTAFFTNETQIDYALESIGGKFPVIIKTVHGTHGIGVIRADSKPSLISIIQQLLKTETEFMLQEYIDHKESARILLLNGEPITAVMRTVPKDSFRSNAHQGAEVKKYEPSKKEIDACIKAAKAIDINFAAVDYILHEDEVILLEVNGSPGFEAMQKAIGDEIDVANKVIEYCNSLLDKKEKPTPTPQESPTEEEEEEEETTVDMDKEVTKEKDKKETKKAMKDDDKVDVEVKSHHNIIDPERWDNEEENIIGTITSVIIKHFEDETPIEARVDTRSPDLFNFGRGY